MAFPLEGKVARAKRVTEGGISPINSQFIIYEEFVNNLFLTFFDLDKIKNLAIIEIAKVKESQSQKQNTVGFADFYLPMKQNSLSLKRS